MQDDDAFATSMLLHLGLVTHHETNPDIVCVTNPGSMKLITRYLYGRSFTAITDGALLSLLEEVSVEYRHLIITTAIYRERLDHCFGL